MTAGRFGAVDLDLLADYVGGVLDGTSDETVVSRLISEDPEWSRAYAELGPAVRVVRESLATWGAATTVMPTDVTDRITAALSAAAPVEAATPVEPGAQVEPALPADADQAATGSPRVPSQPHAERHLVAVPGGKRTTGGRDTPATRRRRRWSRLAGPVAVAAAVTALGGFGVSRLLGTGGDTRTSSGPDAAAPAGSSVAAPGSGEQSRALLGPAVDRPLASGTDYTAGTLAATVDDLAGRSAPATKAGPAAAPEIGRLQAPGGLGRLTDRAALTACLDAVAAEHAGGPIAVELLDYAAFAGNPALVILFTDRSPARWAWVAGPECGVPGSGADTRYQSRVG